MDSDQNPMRNPETHRAALAKTLSRAMSKNEAHFLAWAAERCLPIKSTGDGSFWIGRRNPDARVIDQRKVIEVTQRECFIGERKPRTVEGYGLESLRHYEGKGWRCLVVFKKDHRCVIPPALEPVIRDFVSQDSNWSGVWYFDRLIRLDESPAR
jgi:hypothetical protein